LNPPNPPAFPSPGFTDDPGNAARTIWPEYGMTLRDWFAGAALASIRDDSHNTYASVAEAAYKIADAMLAERAKASTGEGSHS